MIEVPKTLSDTKHSYGYWDPFNSLTHFQLGCDKAGREYFLYLEGLDILMEDQIGFNVFIDWDENTLPIIILQTYIEGDGAVNKMKNTTGWVGVKILRKRNLSSVALDFGTCRIHSYHLGELEGVKRKLSIGIEAFECILTKDEVSELLNEIKFD